METVFEPTYLFRATGQAERVETQEQYDILMAQGDWADSPAVFGIVTAPNREEQLRMGGVGVAMPLMLAPAMPMPAPSDVWGDKMAELESEIESLHGLLASHQAQIDTLTAQVASLASVREKK